MGGGGGGREEERQRSEKGCVFFFPHFDLNLTKINNINKTTIKKKINQLLRSFVGQFINYYWRNLIYPIIYGFIYVARLFFFFLFIYYYYYFFLHE